MRDGTAFDLLSRSGPECEQPFLYVREPAVAPLVFFNGYPRIEPDGKTNEGPIRDRHKPDIVLVSPLDPQVSGSAVSYGQANVVKTVQPSESARKRRLRIESQRSIRGVADDVIVGNLSHKMEGLLQTLPQCELRCDVVIRANVLDWLRLREVLTADQMRPAPTVVWHDYPLFPVERTDGNRSTK